MDTSHYITLFFFVSYMSTSEVTAYPYHDANRLLTAEEQLFLHLTVDYGLPL